MSADAPSSCSCTSNVIGTCVLSVCGFHDIPSTAEPTATGLPLSQPITEKPHACNNLLQAGSVSTKAPGAMSTTNDAVPVCLPGTDNK